MILVLLVSTGFLHCAREKPKSKPRRAPARQTIQKPAPKPEELSTPQREASSRILEIGEQELAVGDLDKAIHTIQESINIDPENGMAYYLLGKAYFQKKDFSQALGLLDKADSLLEDRLEAQQKVRELREAIQGAQNPPDAPGEGGGQTYY